MKTLLLLLFISLSLYATTSKTTSCIKCHPAIVSEFETSMHKKSSIYVGQTVSIKTATNTSTGGVTNDSFKREDVGLTLAVKPRISNGGKVLGICNGFQILTEAKMLPGALKRNDNLHFISKYHHLKVINNENKFLQNLNVGDIVNIPIAHAEGNYKVDKETLKKMYDNGQVILKYCDKDGNELNPNGSVDSIAGICNENKNVFGLMPHPERAMESILGGSDGIKMIEGFLK